MHIVTHRGYWKSLNEKNAEVAFRRSFELGFGTETDFRDFCGKLVIAHDVATAEAMPAHQFFEIYKQYLSKLPLAINVKSDGLQNLMREALETYNITNYFLFDMSVPDALVYIRQGGFNIYTRQSEYEKEPSFYRDAKGVWMDMFFSDWIEEDDILRHLENDKEVCIVSPDLHKREPKMFWERLKKMSVIDSEKVSICTDFPEEAKQFFYGRD